MSEDETRRPPIRIFNTPFESGLRSLFILTACYPVRLGLHRIVVLDYLVVHTADVDGPESLHPNEDSRLAELLVRRQLVHSGLALMGTRGLVARHATKDGFRFEAGLEAGSFIDFLKTPYAVQLKKRAAWLAETVVPMSDEAMNELLRDRIDHWATEFQSDLGLSN